MEKLLCTECDGEGTVITDRITRDGCNYKSEDVELECESCDGSGYDMCESCGMEPGVVIYDKISLCEECLEWQKEEEEG